MRYLIFFITYYALLFIAVSAAGASLVFCALGDDLSVDCTAASIAALILWALMESAAERFRTRPEQWPRR